MKKKRTIILLLLILITVFLAVWNVHTIPDEKEGALLVSYNGKDTYVSLEDIKKEELSLVTVNGKGEEKEISGMGISLEKLLGKYRFETARVIASDEFYATVSKEECADAYLIANSNNDLQLVVIGDKNSKRAVKKPVRIELE